MKVEEVKWGDTAVKLVSALVVEEEVWLHGRIMAEFVDADFEFPWVGFTSVEGLETGIAVTVTETVVLSVVRTVVKDIVVSVIVMAILVEPFMHGVPVY